MKKIGVLIENRFIDREIIYYSNRFKEDGFEVVFLTRLWGQSSLTFKGLELNMPLNVHHSFEDMSDEELDGYAAIIMPAGYVSDYLLYTEKPEGVSPAAAFVKRIMSKKDIFKCFICHSLWIAAPIKEAFSGRKLTCHNNIIAHVKNAGIEYIDADVFVDRDIISARTGDLFSLLSAELLQQLKKSLFKGVGDNKMFEKSIIRGHNIKKIRTAHGILMQDLKHGDNLSALHWNLEDGSIVDWHRHINEQFGYIIKGGFNLYICDEEFSVTVGDAYYIPSNVLHKFVAVGHTEAVDIFNPARTEVPKEQPHSTDDKTDKKRVLVLATNYGVWAEELQAPWDALKKAGFDVTLATPKGKKPLPFALSVNPDFIDAKQHYNVNPKDVCFRVFELMNGNEWSNPIKISEANMRDYDAIVMTGGPGVCLDITNNPHVHRLVREAYYAQKLIGAICYSVGALVFTRDTENHYKSVIWGKKVTAHPRSWDFDFELAYELSGTTPDNKGTDVVTPGFLLPLQDIVLDSVGPLGGCISDATANRENPCVVVDFPFVTALSVESSIEYGKTLVELLKN